MLSCFSENQLSVQGFVGARIRDAESFFMTTPGLDLDDGALRTVVEIGYELSSTGSGTGSETGRRPRTSDRSPGIGRRQLDRLLGPAKHQKRGNATRLARLYPKINPPVWHFSQCRWR